MDDDQGSASKNRSIQALNGSVGLAVVRHIEECVTTRLAGGTVPHHHDFLNRSVGQKQRPELVLGGAVIQVADVYAFHRDLSPLLVRGASSAQRVA